MIRRRSFLFKFHYYVNQLRITEEKKGLNKNMSKTMSIDFFVKKIIMKSYKAKF